VASAHRGAIYLISEVITSLISVVLLIYLARALHPGGFGLYSIAIALSQILGLGGNFGVGTAFRKKLPEKDSNKKKRSELLSNGYFATVIISVAIAICGILASGYLADTVYNNPQMVMPIAIASASVLFYALYNITLAALVGAGHVKESAFSNFGYSFSQLLLIVALVSAGFGVAGAMYGYFFSLAIGFAVGIFYLMKKVDLAALIPSKAKLQEIFGFSLPVFISNILNTGVINLAVVVLGVFATASVVGNYGAADTIAGFVTIIITAISFVILPDFSKMMSDKKLSLRIGDAYNASISFTLLLVLPLVVFAMAAAKPLLAIFISHAYTLAPAYFAIMIAGLMAGVLGSLAGTLLVGFGNTKKFMKYQIAILAVEIILILVLAPLWKAYGVILAIFIIGSIVSDILFMRLLKKDFGIKLEFGKLGKIVLANVILGVILLAITILSGSGYLSILIDAVLALILYPIIVAKCGGVNRAGTQLIRKSSETIPLLGSVMNLLMDYTEVIIG
jgi:O-antigen/teichoic acid export membrane protein